MRYKGYRVQGVPRSGNHYLAHLVGINFFNLKNIRLGIVGHDLGGHIGSGNPAVFYIWRQFDAVARSIYDMRARFGIGDITYEDLLARPLNELCTYDCTADHTYNAGIREERQKVHRDFMGRNRMTLKEFWTKHRDNWLAFAAKHPQVLVFQYEKLLSDFEAQMSRIAVYLESDLTEFQDVRERVGWYTTGTYWNDRSKRS